MFMDKDFSDEVGENSENESKDSDNSSDEFQIEGFASPTHIVSISSITKEYILHITATRSSDPDVAVASSDGNIKVLRMKDGNPCDSFEVKNVTKHIVEMEFDKFDNNLLWVADHTGIINLFDVRTPHKPSLTFSDTTDTKEEKDKKFNCFDVSSCGRLLCAGTDKFNDDAFILFWDIRKRNLAGGWWESHTDDITQLKFHPSETSKFFSASTDGLINVYDINHSCEEDALVDTLNTESSIEKICYGDFGRKNILSCITHTADIQFWRTEDVQPFASFKRDQVTELLKRKSETYSYVVNVHRTDDSFLVIAGATEKRGKHVGVFKLEGKSLKPCFGLHKNQQRILCSSYNENTRLLLTGGEKGMVDAWRLSNEL